MGTPDDILGASSGSPSGAAMPHVVFTSHLQNFVSCPASASRHASGERLAMGSTTGGLWTSMNGGDSWQCTSTNLPPVYCVRFWT